MFWQDGTKFEGNF